MIHIAIGTKAQLIKMAPILRLLTHKGIPYNLIDLGQHSLITQELRQEFNLSEPAVFLSKGANIASLLEAWKWLLKIVFKSLSASRIKKEIFLNQQGVCLIHGDTLSTLIGLYLAKRAGLKVAHIEAGLRSFCWHEPFPEELFRIITMRFSDVLFAPSHWAYTNLARMGFQKKAILVYSNTGKESAFLSLEKSVDLNIPCADFALVTFHRIENIFSRKRLVSIIKTLEKISSSLPVVFVQHQPTINQLKKFHLWNKLKTIKNVSYFRILSHGHFIHLLNRCKFVLTDGGSIQEEAFYLGKPCLLLRCHTERDEGLQQNAVLSRFNAKTMDYFISHYSEFKRPRITASLPYASETIVENLTRYI